MLTRLPAPHDQPLSQRAGSIVPMLLLGVALSSCGKQEQPKAPAKAVALTAATKTDNEFLKTLASVEKPEDDQDKLKDDMAEEIASFKRDHPFSDATEMLKLSAFTEKLGPLLQAAVKEHHFMDRVQKSVDMAAKIKDDAPPGSYKLDLKVDGYTPERTDRLLGSVLSGDPERLVNFVLTEVDHAGMEFSLLPGTDRATNGITVAPNPAPPPPK